MESKSKLDRLLEIYKCIALTIIAVILLGIFLRTPVPFTIKNIQAEKVEMRDIPVVRVHGGIVNVPTW